MDWKKKLSKADLEGPTFKIVRPFHDNIISLQFQMEECHLLLTDQVNLVNPEGYRVVLDVRKPLPLRGQPSQVIIQRQYFFNKDLEYLMSGQLNHLHLQGQLNHLSGADKVHLFNAVNLWIRNIVIRKRVEDLQLGIESYQTKLNLTQPDWDASDFLFKEDYTIVSKPRALDYMVKEFKLFKYNPGMETRIWSEDDRRRSKEFMEVINRRLKIRRIFKSLNIRVIPKYHSEDGNPARANIKQALGLYKDGDGDGDTLFQQKSRSTREDVLTLSGKLCLRNLESWKRISDKRTKNKAKNDKTEHENRKSVKQKSKSKPKP
ncbi:hypothetical protein Tco_0642656 [Tanacetum coccineum]